MAAAASRLTATDVAEVELSARRIAEADPQVTNADELLTAALARTSNFRITRHDLRDGEVYHLTAVCGRVLDAARKARA